MLNLCGHQTQQTSLCHVYITPNCSAAYPLSLLLPYIVPITLLREGEGHVVTIEMKNGQIYRGRLTDTEETMNCALNDVTSTARDGKVSKLEQVYVRGSYVKYIVLPDVLKNAPIFKGVQKVCACER